MKQDSNDSSFSSLYRLTCQVGKGGYGDVYEGVRMGEDGVVAVKFVWKDRVRRWGQVGYYHMHLKTIIIFMLR